LSGGTNASGNTGADSPEVYQAPNLVGIMSIEGIQEVSAVKGVIPAEYENAIGGQVNPDFEVRHERMAVP
jgi:hypothetical protein